MLARKVFTHQWRVGPGQGKDLKKTCNLLVEGSFLNFLYKKRGPEKPSKGKL